MKKITAVQQGSATSKYDTTFIVQKNAMIKYVNMRDNHVNM